MASVSGSEVSEGPVLSLITKKLRALKKKLNRIVQLEESLAQGKKPVNKEQEDLLKSKPAVTVLIDEYEKLRQPLSAALQEELSRLSPPPPSPTPAPATQPEESADDEQKRTEELEDLLRLLYFGCLFDVKTQSEFTLLTRTHERGCCLTYDYVTDDATDLLGEGDLDMISELSGLLTSRPVCAGVSHKNALEECIQRAKLWLQKSEEPILPGASVTYAALREKLNKITALDYFTMTPEMKAPVDVAAAVGKYNSQIQAGEGGAVPTQDEHQVDDAPVHYEQKEDEQEEIQASDSADQSSPHDESEKDDSNLQIPSGDSITGQQEQERVEADSEPNQEDPEHGEQQQYIPRRGYQNQRYRNLTQRRGGGGGGGRGYYSNGRGGRGGRGGGSGGYQNGRSQQYYDSGYNPRNNYHNTRGRGGGGRSGVPATYNNNHGAAHGSQVELGANS